MHKQFVPYLVDPETGDDLTLEVTEANGDFVESGFLISPHNRYPIVRGIPRFVPYEDDNYSSSFGFQWNRAKWSRVQFEAENVGKPMAGWTRTMWEKITGDNDRQQDLSGKVLLDIGCGPGRFVDVARDKGARMIGLDYSSAVEAAEVNFKDDPEVCICQADALSPPIRKNSMDGAYSIGVLHHTPSPKEGVARAYDCIKPGGWFAISVYAVGTYYNFRSVNLVRRMMKLLWPWFGPTPALIYTYLTVYLLYPFDRYSPMLRNFFGYFLPHQPLADINWSLLDTFDSVTPSYQSAHTSYEVFNWFKQVGFRTIEPTDWSFTAYLGEK